MFRWLKFLFWPSGRVSRRQMWTAYAPTVIASAIAIGGAVAGVRTLVDGAANLRQTDYAQIAGLSFLAFNALPLIIVPSKRYRDRGKTGWLAPFNLIVGAGLAFFALVNIGLLNPKADVPAWRMMLGFAFAAATVIVFAVSAIELYFLRGERGPNQYGPDPLEPPAAVPATAFKRSDSATAHKDDHQSTLDPEPITADPLNRPWK